MARGTDHPCRTGIYREVEKEGTYACTGASTGRTQMSNVVILLAFFTCKIDDHDSA